MNLKELAATILLFLSNIVMDYEFFSILVAKG